MAPRSWLGAGWGWKSILGWQRGSLGMWCWDLASIGLWQPLQEEPQMSHAAKDVALCLPFSSCKPRDHPSLER